MVINLFRVPQLKFILSSDDELLLHYGFEK